MIFNRIPVPSSFLVLLILVLSQAVSLSALGSREDPVVEAEQLIEENRYNEAAGLLREVVRRQPERFDEVEALLRRIRTARARYNDLWEELLFVLENEPDNVDQAFRVIAEMETIDEAPSSEAVEEFQQWRDIVVLRFNLDQFEQISSQAAEAIEEERYIDALLTYREGLGLFREEFESLSYADDLGPRAFEIESELAAGAEELGALASGLQTAVEQYVQELDSDPQDNEALLDSADTLRGRLVEYFDAEINLAALGSELRDLGREAQSRRAMNDPDPYLTFTAWFAFGRTAAEGREGLFGAARAIANQQIQIVRAAGPPDAREGLQAADALTEARDYDAAASAWSEAEVKYAALSEVFSSLDSWEDFRSSRVPDLNRAEVNVRREERASYQYAEESAAITAELTGLSLSLLEQFDGAEDDLESWRTVTQGYRDAVEIRSQLEDRAELLSQAAGLADDTAALVRTNHDRLITDVTVLDRNIAENLFEERYGTALEFYEELLERQQSAEVIAFIGVEAEEPEEVPSLAREPAGDDTDDLLLYRYPDIASERLESVRDEAVELETDIRAALALFDEANDPVGNDTDIEALQNQITELGEQLSELQDRTEVAIADADARFIESQDLQTEVVETLDEAESLVSDDPDAAQILFDDASDRLVESLELRQDPSFRTAMDDRLAVLGEEIQEARFRIIVVEVRDRIEEGRSLYRQDAFGDAERVLLEARERWNSVNDEENTEVEFWLRLTQSALNLQGDRDLLETDPLFRPLAGYLSLAFDAFERAEDEREAGNIEQSSELLTRAEQNIQAVVSARPFNQEARVLSLRITRLTNPDEFPEIFEQRYEQALALAESDALQALNDLYDLQEINPDYPGIEQSIERVEIAAGVREAPIDQEALNRSTQLVSQARDIWQPGDRDSAERAQELLQEAIDLNPENRDAISLLDDVRLDLGSTTVATLSSTGLQQLRQAENLFLDGSIGRAIVIVERLWQDEDNRRFPPLAD
ncbi:MAG: hypothetical protein ACOC4I_00415, partial [Spirochaetota bacterium]